MAHREFTLLATFMDWEACYLPEWLAFHFKLGVTRVYLFPSWSPTLPQWEEHHPLARTAESLKYGEAPFPWRGPFQNMFFSTFVQPMIHETTLKAALEKCDAHPQCHAVTKSPYTGFIGKRGMTPKPSKIGEISWWNPKEAPWNEGDKMLRRASWFKGEGVRNYTNSDPRVHVVCDVRGQPGSCLDEDAKPYASRRFVTDMIIKSLVPRHAGGWLSLIDLDEFFTIPLHEDPNVKLRATTLIDVLDELHMRNASLLRVPELTYGANNVSTNPNCETLRYFQTAAMELCHHNYYYKTMFRALPGVVQPIGTRNASDPGPNAHIQVELPLHRSHEYYAADGDLTPWHIYVRNHPCKDAHCIKNGPMIYRTKSTADAPGGRPPILQIRHYNSRSRSEWFAKIERYQRQYNLQNNAYKYAPAHARYLELDQPASELVKVGDSWHNFAKVTNIDPHCRRERFACRPIAGPFPEICPKDKEWKVTDEYKWFTKLAHKAAAKSGTGSFRSKKG